MSGGRRLKRRASSCIRIAVVLYSTTCVVDGADDLSDMVRLSKLELRVMEAFWTVGSGSIRKILQTFPAKARPAYTTVQTIVYRLEAKKALRRAKKISNADIFEPQITRSAAHRRLVEDFLAQFGGQTQPVMAHLIQSGKLTLEDIQEAERTLRSLSERKHPK